MSHEEIDKRVYDKVELALSQSKIKDISSDLYKVRKMLENYNRDNGKDHEILKMDIFKLVGSQSAIKEDVENLKQKNLWHITLDFLKDKPGVVVTMFLSYLTLNNLPYIYQIIELIFEK
jgi:hypothetical protein